MNLSKIMLAGTLAAFMGASAIAQNDASDSKPVDSKPAEAKPCDAKPVRQQRGPETTQTFYLQNAGEQTDLNDIQTTIRNMISQAKLFADPSQLSITIRGTSDELATAQKLVTELDLPKKIYRLTYTITESDGGKRIGVQHSSLVVISGERTVLKQGSKVPFGVGSSGSGASDHGSQVEYEDVGLEITAWAGSNADGVRLRSKVVQSSLAEEKSGVAAQDPVIRETTLEGTSTLALGKPLVLGSLDIPGSTRHEEIEVVSELIR
jgi:type II secretory pathway component GspD/PulD (secretin)